MLRVIFLCDFSKKFSLNVHDTFIFDRIRGNLLNDLFKFNFFISVRISFVLTAN